ncbi:TcpE family conjugal transfer membrane protein [Priestia megaterium]|uniref:TcpE family conjugal transfer membrane protein n=1 Tax=Priestia megaterium TaxID=1404 RepID=UPI00406BCB59
MRKQAMSYGVLFKYPPKIYKINEFVFSKGLELRQIIGYIVLEIIIFFFRNTTPFELLRTLPFALWITAWLVTPWYLAGLLLKISTEGKTIFHYTLSHFKFVFLKKEYVKFRPLEVRGKKIFKYDGVNRN